MLILLGMLLIGLFTAVWGFMMCFLPAHSERLRSNRRANSSLDVSRTKACGSDHKTN